MNLLNQIRLYFFCSLLVLNLSCKSENEGGDSDGSVTIRTSGALDPLEIVVDTALNMGYFLVGQEPRIITYTFRNTSRYNFTHFNVFISDEITAGMTFALTTGGTNAFPGSGGTCQRILQPGQQCTVKISYNPSLPGAFTQRIDISYRNLVEAVEVSQELRMITGEPASVIFVNEITNYNLGIIERTFKDDSQLQELVIENRGGLPAFNFNISLNNTPDSGAFKIIETNCPETLFINQGCRLVVEFLPQNWGAGAPDGDTDLFSYQTIVRFNYERDPFGTQANLNGRISAFATTIEGRMEPRGLEEFSFNELVVGNIQNKQFRFTNAGFKESIIKAMHVSNSGGNRLASCIKVDDSNKLECRAPSIDLLGSPALTLEQFPFRLEDTNNCLTELPSLGYERLEDLSLSTDGVRLVGAQTPLTAAEVCFFQMTFHPSVAYLESGNFNGLKISMEYDSTWLNQIVLYDSLAFTVVEAKYIAAANLNNTRFRLHGDAVTRLPVIEESLYEYDIGRITLISNSAYRTNIDFNLLNLGGSPAEILNIKDGAGNLVTSSQQQFNPYYRIVSHDQCSLLPGGGAGECNVVIRLTPLASSNPDGLAAQLEENGQMFDVLADPSCLCSGEPECACSTVNYKSFTIEYRDGALYEDDMSERVPRKFDLRMRANLVRKAFLVYDENNVSGGEIGGIPYYNEAEYSFAIRNVGTGPIPYISFLPDLDLQGLLAKSEGNPYPFELVAKSSSDVNEETELFVDYDCLDLIFDHTAGLPTAIMGLAPPILQAGEACSFSLKSKLRTTDIIFSSQYIENGGTNSSEWNRATFRSSSIASRNWEGLIREFLTEVHFRYYDGDGIADVENGYTPNLAGYGNLYNIGLPGQANKVISVLFEKPASLVIDDPLPRTSAVIYKPELSLPAIPLDQWGEAIDSFLVSGLWSYVGEGSPSNLAIPAYRSKNYVEASAHRADFSTANYTFHAGSFPAGGSYDFRFILENTGDIEARIVNTILTVVSSDSDAIELSNNPGDDFELAAGGGRGLSFVFRPQAADVGVHTAYLTVSYETGVILNPVTEVKEINELVVKIVVESLVSTSGQPVLSYQNIRVDYDPFSDPQYQELTLPGSVSPVMGFNEAPAAEQLIDYIAVRGGAIYEIKSFTVTNPHPEPIRDLTFFIKPSVGATSILNQSAATEYGYKVLENECDVVVLNQNESCSFDIKFKASPSEAATNSVVGTLSYHWAKENQMVNTFFNLRFNAVNPAVLTVQAISPTTVVDSAGNQVPNSFPINYGSFSPVGNHSVLNIFPRTELSLPTDITILNVSGQKASFIEQYRRFVGDDTSNPPVTAWTLVYNERNLSIEMSTGCFYGDDSGDSVMNIDLKGFNNSSAVSCTIRPIYSAGDEYLNDSIKISENIHRLYFFDNLRSSIGFINFYATGFIEANRSTRGSGDLIYDLYTDETGVLELSWKEMLPNNLSWGNIVGYRVFYSNRSSFVDNFYTSTSVLSKDSATNSITLTGLSPLTVYYLRIVAIRQIESKQYISRDLDWARYHFVTPDNDHFYDFATHSLITKRLSPIGEPIFQGTKSQANSYCSSRKLRISQNGSNFNFDMRMIQAPQYAAIQNNPDFTITGDGRPLSIVPHWISGAPVDIVPIFGPDSEFLLSGNVDFLFFMKPCESCNQLDYIEGGDAENFPPGSVIFVSGENFGAMARCYMARPN